MLTDQKQKWTITSCNVNNEIKFPKARNPENFVCRYFCDLGVPSLDVSFHLLCLMQLLLSWFPKKNCTNHVSSPCRYTHVRVSSFASPSNNTNFRQCLWYSKNFNLCKSKKTHTTCFPSFLILVTQNKTGTHKTVDGAEDWILVANDTWNYEKTNNSPRDIFLNCVMLEKMACRLTKNRFSCWWFWGCETNLSDTKPKMW